MNSSSNFRPNTVCSISICYVCCVESKPRSNLCFFAGHCGIPSNFPEDLDLLEWISKQHSAYFASKLSQNQIDRLVGISFVFNNEGTGLDEEKKPAAGGRVSWNQHFENLKAFKECSYVANDSRIMLYSLSLILIHILCVLSCRSCTDTLVYLLIIRLTLASEGGATTSASSLQKAKGHARIVWRSSMT